MTTPRKPSAGIGAARSIEAPQSIPEQRSRAKHLRLGLVNPLLARASRVARAAVELSQDALAAGIDWKQTHVSDAENDTKPESFTLQHLGTALRSEGAVREWGVSMLRTLCAVAGGRFEHSAKLCEETDLVRLARILRECADVTASIAARCADGVNTLAEIEHELTQVREVLALYSQHEARLVHLEAQARGLR
jgi:hypothetical protein